MAEAEGRPPLLDRRQTYASINDKISAIVLSGTRRGWLLLFATGTLFALLFGYAVSLVLSVGIGILDANVPVAWGYPIVNVVWWIGIGHAGTLISAILLLMQQPWRNSINRFAEAMTIFAVGIAGLFPLIHLGRPWFAYWVAPYPNTMGLWPQWRSPLVWDFFAIATYVLVSLLFWYMGLIPDLATLRDRARRRLPQIVYGCLALGWRGSAIHWRRYRSAYLYIAALAAALVVSVHSIIALDFAMTLVPGYHSAMMPPYFVAGALYSGFAMVLTITIPMRAAFGLHDLITARHMDVLAKVMLAAGLVVAYSYVVEYFMIWYNGDEAHRHMAVNRALGDYAPHFWAMLACNVLAIQALWFQRVRSHVPTLFAVSLIVNVGMWLERYVIVYSGPSHGFLPSAWGARFGNSVDAMMLAGSLGLFLVLLLLFIRFLPAISIYEVRELLHDRKQQGDSS